MRYTMTMHEAEYQCLVDHLFADPEAEGAAYLLCRQSKTNEETRLLVREVIPVEKPEVVAASNASMKIGQMSYIRAIQKANERKESFIFVHSHPEIFPEHSQQDDDEERKLFRTAYMRVHADVTHGSVVFSAPDSPQGRVWLPDGTTTPIDCIRVIGYRFKFFFNRRSYSFDPRFFDRQIRAFGADVQALLHHLHVGVVGAGGTGSSTIEQLIRLGVGKLTIADGDSFDPSNVNRVYGSRIRDEGTPKVQLMERLHVDIGLPTEIRVIDQPITYESVLAAFRNCDVIFGCTDDEWGRSLLTRFSIYYMIPVFDMGVRIDSSEGTIRSVQGRVTTLMPSTSCLFCRERLQPERILAETTQAVSPENAERLRREGYAPELEDSAPAVIPFTTAVAASAVTEFIHRLTGFKGDAESSEVVLLIDSGKSGRNSRPSTDGCFCGDRMYWGRGDCQPLLDVTWRQQ